MLQNDRKHEGRLAVSITPMPSTFPPDDVKLKLQAYVSGCYGTLTSFNILFADPEDQFKGSGGD